MTTAIQLAPTDRVMNAPIVYVHDFQFLCDYFEIIGPTWRGPAYSGLDIETEGVLSPYDGEIACVQIELDGKCYVVHWDSDKTLTDVPFVHLFRDYLECPKVTKVIHNVRFELTFFLHAFGDDLDCTKLIDTMAGEYILSEGMADEEMGFARVNIDLGSVVRKRYGFDMDKDHDLRTSFRRRGHIEVIPPKKSGGRPNCYACGVPATLIAGAREAIPVCHLHNADVKKSLKRYEVEPTDYDETYNESYDLSDRQLRYAALDALWAAQLAQDQIEQMTMLEIEQGENYLSLLDLDSKVAECIASMQLHGIPVNRDKLMCLDAEWQYRAGRLQEDILDAVCFTNILPKLRELHPEKFGSAKEEDLPKLLGYWKQPSAAALKKHEEQGGEAPQPKFVEAEDFPKISSGEQMVPRLQALGYAIPSYEGHELKHYKGDKLIDAILEWKMISKLQTTYSEGFLLRIHPVTGRVHGSFNQFRTSTGRLASSDPNLQNLPSKSAEGNEMRECVEAESDDMTLVIADYSQLELRQIAQTYNDAAMREAFAKGLDLHSLFASKMLGIPYEEIEAGKDGPYKKKRAQAKPANFGLGYGAGVDQFMFIAWAQYGIVFTRDEATNIRAMWLDMYAGVRAYHESMKQIIRNGTGMIRVKTVEGRTRKLPREWKNKAGERKTAYAAALNHPIQGTGADGVKRAMITLRPLLKQYGARIILQVHDELVVYCKKIHAETIRALMERVMIDAMQPYLPDVPCLVDAKVSPSWCK